MLSACQSACNGKCKNFFLFKNWHSWAEPVLGHESTFYPDCQLFFLKQPSTNTCLSYWLLSSKKPNLSSVKILKMYLLCMKRDLLELTSKKYLLFIIGDWYAKVWRNTWSNRQVWPWSEEWSRAKTNRVLPRECTGDSKYPLSTTQEKTLHMDITRWSTPKSEWLYSLQPKMEKFYTVSKNKTGSWMWLRSWTPYCKIQAYIEELWENH